MTRCLATNLAEFIKSPNRFASPVNLTWQPGGSELATLIHPLSNPVQPTLHTTYDLSQYAVTSISATRSPAIVTPVTFGPGRDLLQEYISASASHVAPLQIR